jgi:hypothetical protein
LDQRFRSLVDLRRVLPDWPVNATLIETSAELLRLERDIEVARSVGVPDAIIERLIEHVEAAGAILFRRVERLAAVGSMVEGNTENGPEVESSRALLAGLTDSLDGERARLSQLRDAIREARAGLAELTLADGQERDAEEFARVSRRFRALADAARELQEL